MNGDENFVTLMPTANENLNEESLEKFKVVNPSGLSFKQRSKDMRRQIPEDG